MLHDLTTGSSASGILHFLNQTPIDAFSKWPNQVESATYGSEFTVAHQAIEQIIDLCYTLCMLGIPLEGPLWLFGDNKSAVTSSTVSHLTLYKCWNALSYHKVQETVVSGFVHFGHIPTGDNPAVIFTKPLPSHIAHIHVEPLLFWKGDTSTDMVDLVSSSVPIRGE